jgi:hypothetical protein
VHNVMFLYNCLFFKVKEIINIIFDRLVHLVEKGKSMYVHADIKNSQRSEYLSDISYEHHS